MKLSSTITRTFFVCLTSLLLAGPVGAHGDEDHSAPTVTATVHQLPRIAVTTEEFELVAVLEPGQLLIYLDRADSNQPVAQAQIEVEGAGPVLAATEVAPGLYALALAQPLPAGAHALTFTVQTPDSGDLISATLEVPPAADAPPAQASSSARMSAAAGLWPWGAAGISLGIAGFAWVALRRRSSTASA